MTLSTKFAAFLISVLVATCATLFVSISQIDPKQGACSMGASDPQGCAIHTIVTNAQK